MKNKQISRILQWLCAGVAIVGAAGMLATDAESDMWFTVLMISFGLFLIGLFGCYVFKNPREFVNSCYAVVAVVYVWLHRHDRNFIHMVEKQCGKPISYKAVFYFVREHR